MNAEKILRDSSNQREFMHKYRRVMAAKNAAPRITPQTDRCPTCNNGLKKRALETEGDTLVHCVWCGWFQRFRGTILVDARRIGESFVPGVTGKPRGRPLVAIDRFGRFKRVIRK